MSSNNKQNPHLAQILLVTVFFTGSVGCSQFESTQYEQLSQSSQDRIIEVESDKNVKPTIETLLPTESNFENDVEITLRGENFTETMLIRIGDRFCDELTIESKKQATCRLNPHFAEETVSLFVSAHRDAEMTEALEEAFSWKRPPLFKAGQEVTAENIPTTRPYLLSELATYKTTEGFRAIALAANGYGWLVYSRDGRNATNGDSANQAEANRRALEACQIASNNQPCSIFAEGNTVTSNETEFYGNMDLAIDLNDKVFAANKVPAVSDFWRNSFTINEYANRGGQKAHFLSLNGGEGTGYEFGTLQQALSRASQECEGQNPNLCIHYATNNEVVLTPQSIATFFSEKIEGR